MNKSVKVLGVVLCLALAAGSISVRVAAGGGPVSPAPVPSEVRQAALKNGLVDLSPVLAPAPPNLAEFLNSGPAAKTAAIQLGKAFFWDTQAGSDGQACASCHFHAGADNRVKNQLNPGFRHVPASNVFNPTHSGNGSGPNYALTARVH